MSMDRRIIAVVIIGVAAIATWGLLSAGHPDAQDGRNAPPLPQAAIGPEPAVQGNDTAEEDDDQAALFAYIEETDVVLGDLDAPVSLVEFGDYQCTFCTRFFFETKDTLVRDYVETGKLKYIFRDFPVNGRESQQAAEASECAAEQGKFWEYHDKLYQERTGYNTGAFSRANLITYAGELGLEVDQFTTCYDAGRYEDEIAKDMREGRALGVSGTPTFIINGQRLVGAQPTSVFTQAIDRFLAE